MTIKKLLRENPPLLLGVVVLSIYWKSLQYPFIEDDWLILHSIVTKGPVEFLRGILLPTLGSFYRPLGQTLVLLGYLVFGLDPTGYHIVALVVHMVNVLLVASVIRTLTNDQWMGWISAFLYQPRCLCRWIPC